MYNALFNKIYMSRARLLVVTLDNLVSNISNPSVQEKEILQQALRWVDYKTDKYKHKLVDYYNDLYDKEELYRVFDFESQNIRPIRQDGIQLLADISSKYYNVVNNSRLTTGQPRNYSSTVHIFGHCNAVGVFAEDKYTIASQLQNCFNEESFDGIRVVNSSNWGDFFVTARQILSPRYSFNTHDFVIIFTNTFDQQLCDQALMSFQDKSFFDYYDLSHIFQRPHKFGDVLFDNLHMAHRGYEIISKHIFNIIVSRIVQKGQELIDSQYVSSYLASLSALKKDDVNGVVGSIVMNCNPFTLGHRYLVEKALEKCDYLYIFVLEEDRSFFKFKDRIAMVRRGLEDIKNVSVVSSGKMIISSHTMPEYFKKDEIQDVLIDTSYDITLFCTKIAPVLNITKRFAGNEPLCQITNQYNDGMRQMLPLYGIEFVEIERREKDGAVISASRVRRHINNSEHDMIINLVPLSTYNYLREHEYIPSSETLNADVSATNQCAGIDVLIQDKISRLSVQNIRLKQLIKNNYYKFRQFSKDREQLLQEVLDKSISLERSTDITRSQVRALNAFATERIALLNSIHMLCTELPLSKLLKIPFNEKYYLSVNKDVEDAVRQNTIFSGFVHWLLYGFYEKRSVLFSQEEDTFNQ